MLLNSNFNWLLQQLHCLIYHVVDKSLLDQLATYAWYKEFLWYNFSYVFDCKDYCMET